jgi:hypothetical protein
MRVAWANSKLLVAIVKAAPSVSHVETVKTIATSADRAKIAEIADLANKAKIAKIVQSVGHVLRGKASKANKVSGKTAAVVPTVVVAADVMVATKDHKAKIATRPVQMFLMNQSVQSPSKLRATSIFAMRGTASCALVATCPPVKMHTYQSN